MDEDLHYKYIGEAVREIGDGVHSFGMDHTPLLLCRRCGNVVAEIAVHDDFHRKLEQLERRIRGTTFVRTTNVPPA